MPDTSVFKPILGDIVIVRGIASNGTYEHPAMVTRVWSQGPDDSYCINAVVFPDLAAPLQVGSIFLFPTSEDALSFIRGKKSPPGDILDRIVAFWPETEIV